MWPSSASSAARTSSDRIDIESVRSTEGTSRPGTDPLQQAAKHAVGIKVRLGDGTCGAGVTVVIAADRIDAREDVVLGLERDQTRPGWQEATESRLLGEDRTARGEVAD